MEEKQHKELEENVRRKVDAINTIKVSEELRKMEKEEKDKVGSMYAK